MTVSNPRFRPRLMACAALLALVPTIVLSCADGSKPDPDPTPVTGMPSSSGTQVGPATMPTASASVTPTTTVPTTDDGSGVGAPTSPGTPAVDPTGAGPDDSASGVSPTGADSSGDTSETTTMPDVMTGETTEEPSPDDGMPDAGTGMPDDMTLDDTSTQGMTSNESTVDEMTPDDTTGDTGPVFHIFLMMGQSNMVGVAGLQESDRNTDERLQVLGGCNKPPMQWNLADPPLHDCYMNPVGPGDWFGKVMLEKLPEGHTIGLVPTAVSGESINTFISGGTHHQDILNKIEFAKNTPNARFAGIIFHQGETDTNQEWWVDRVVQLYNEVKAAMGIDYDIPFIAGELPADPGNCCASHNPRVHQLPDALPMAYVVSQEGTKRFDQYHFDHDSVVLMGKRYGETMLEALGW